MRVRVQPRSSRDTVERVRDGALVVRLTAPPVDGKANAALARLLGSLLDVPPSAVRVARGASGRDKLVCIAGASLERIRTRLAADGPS
jgi:uncharacterized protein